MSSGGDDDKERHVQRKQARFSHGAALYYGSNSPPARHRPDAAAADSRPPSLALRLLRDHWTLELASILFACACLAAMAVVLHALDGRAVSAWPLRIHPAALLQIFATLGRAALLYPVAQVIAQAKWMRFGAAPRPLAELELYDGAARGVRGALQLLWSVNVSDFVASLAAVLTVAALAMGACTQQATAYRTRLVSTGDASASMQVANSYDSGLRPPAGAPPQPMSAGLQAAMLYGLQGTPSTPPYSCAAGNCTFQSATSLGICSSCDDVTAVLGRSYSTPTSAAPMVCNFTAPSGLTLNATDGQTLLTSTANSSTADFATRITGETQSALALFDVLADPFGEPRAHQCLLSFCSLAYSSTRVSAGALHLGPADVGRLSLSAVATNASGSFAVYTTLDGDGVGPPATYAVNIADVSSIAATLTALFSTALSTDGSAPRGLATIDIAAMLHATDNLPVLIQNMTDSMTAAVRAAGHIPVAGASYEPEAYTAVQWGWFAVPATLTFSAAALLLMAVVLNATTAQRLWKASALAYVFHGPAWEALGVHTARWQRPSEMDERAAALDVQLERTVTGSARLVLR